ncbi:hypothetical protein AGMMS50256_21460 [Betaproteobacteria bacterium]|nr:hypothetical protein AGMMS50256_21460 [Betaproteobacteria bacterium]
MKKAIRLTGAGIDRYSAANEILADFKELDSEIFDHSVLVDGGDDLDRDGFLPDGIHKMKEGIEYVFECSS